MDLPSVFCEKELYIWPGKIQYAQKAGYLEKQGKARYGANWTEVC